MNDFTREDLCLIVDGLTLLSYENTDKGNSTALRAKIISMIDNYCVHESDGAIYETIDYTRGSQYKCIKCGIRYDYINYTY